MSLKITDSFLSSGKIVVLSGRIVHIKGNKEDLILRLNDEFMIFMDKMVKTVNLGYGNIREATIKEKEYWFLCHNNSSFPFGVCSILSYMKWDSINNT